MSKRKEIELYPHQINAVKCMRQQEMHSVTVNLSTSLSSDGEQIIIPSRNGTLGLGFGHGKTFTVLHYIETRLREDDSQLFLVLVPYSLIGQWLTETRRYYSKEFIEKYCLLAHVGKSLDNRPEEFINSRRVFIVNSSLFKSFGHVRENASEKRKEYVRLCMKRRQVFFSKMYATIFMDEEEKYVCFNSESENSLSLFNFVWLLSATKSYGVYPWHTSNSDSVYGKITQMLAENNHVNDFQVDFIPQHLFSFKKYYIKFSNPLKNVVPKEIANVIQLMSSANQTDWLNAKMQSLENDIANYREKLSKYEQKQQDENLQQDAKIAKITLKINQAQELYNRIKERNRLETVCPICLDDFIKRICLPCCLKSICLGCLKSIWTPGHNLCCPMCRQVNSSSQFLNELRELLKQNNVAVAEKLPSFMTKYKELMYFLKNKQQKTLIVYEGNIQVKDPLDDLLGIYNNDDDNEQKPIILKGNNQAINHQLNQFKNKNNIMYMNALYFNYGMNLEFVDNLVLLNGIRQKDQILGRVQRPGRRTELNFFIFKDI